MKHFVSSKFQEIRRTAKEQCSSKKATGSPAESCRAKIAYRGVLYRAINRRPGYAYHAQSLAGNCLGRVCI